MQVSGVGWLGTSHCVRNPGGNALLCPKFAFQAFSALPSGPRVRGGSNRGVPETGHGDGSATWSRARGRGAPAGTRACNAICTVAWRFLFSSHEREIEEPRRKFRSLIPAPRSVTAHFGGSGVPVPHPASGVYSPPEGTRDLTGLRGEKTTLLHDMGVTRWFHGVASARFAVFVCCVVLACLCFDGVDAAANTPAASQRVTKHNTYRRLLANDYDAPGKRVSGDYADAAEDAALWEKDEAKDDSDSSIPKAQAPPPPRPKPKKSKSPPLSPPPPEKEKLSPSPKLPLAPPPKRVTKPDLPKERSGEDDEGEQIDEEESFEEEEEEESAEDESEPAASAKKASKKAAKRAKEKKDDEGEDYDEDDDEEELSSKPVMSKQSQPPSPLSQAEFMQKMEAEWNAIGDGDEKKGDDGDEKDSGDAEDGEEDTKEDTEDTEDDDGEDGEEETYASATEETSSVPDSSDASSEKFTGAVEAAGSGEKQKAAQTRQTAERSGRQSEQVASPTAELAESETFGNANAKEVGVASDVSVLPNDGSSRSHKNTLIGVAVIASTCGLAAVVFHTKVSIDNARPHSSIELGSSSFKRPGRESGVPIKYAKLGGDSGANKGGALKKKFHENTGSRASRPPATQGLDMAGGTALFGDSGHGRRGKKHADRKTTREEDAFYG